MYNFFYSLEDGKSIYLVHEVMDYEGFGKTGAVSLWRKGRDPMGKPIYQKVQVTGSITLQGVP